MGFYPPSCRKGSLHGHYGEEEDKDDDEEEDKREEKTR